MDQTLFRGSRPGAMVLFVALVMTLGTTAVHAAAKTKQPVPAAGKLAEAEKSIRAIYAAEFGETDAEARLGLAGRLREAADKEGVAPAERYVLLREAGAAAAAAGDAKVAVECADEMAAAFDVEAPKLKLEVLQAAAKAAARDPDASRNVAEAALAVADDAVTGGDFASANAAAGVADSAARAVRDPGFSDPIRARAKHIKRVQAEFKQVQPLLAKLKTAPDDPSANLKVGRFYCFSTGGWKKGLPHLARGADAALKELAEQELADPPDLAGRMKLADGWWEAAAREPETVAEGIKRHALDWYKRADEQAQGVTKERIAQRMAEFQPKSATVNLLRIVKPGRDTIAGNWGGKGKGLMSDMEGSATIQFPYAPPAEYDYRITFKMVNGYGYITQILPDGKGGSFTFRMSQQDFGFQGVRRSADDAGAGADPDGGMKRIGKPVKYGDIIDIVVKVRKDGAKAYVKGSLASEIVGEVNGYSGSDLRDGKFIGVTTSTTQILIQRAEVKEVSGQGEKVSK